jgi:hypothetical protein
MVAARQAVLLHSGVHEHLKDQIELDKQILGDEWEDLRTKTYDIDASEVRGQIENTVAELKSIKAVRVPLILRNTAQFGHVGLSGKDKEGNVFDYGMPVMYVDASYCYKANNAILRHERDEIIQWEDLRINKLGIETRKEMRDWIIKYASGDKTDERLDDYQELKGETSIEIAEIFHKKAYPLDELYDLLPDIDSDKFLEFFNYSYIRDLFDRYVTEEGADVNIAAHDKIVVSGMSVVSEPEIRILGSLATINDGRDNIDELIKNRKVNILKLKDFSNRPPDVFTLIDIGDKSTRDKGIKYSPKQKMSAVLNFLRNDNYHNLQMILSFATKREISLDKIKGPVDIVCSKYGSFEDIFQVIVRLKDRQEPFLMALHVPMDSAADSLFMNECKNHTRLKNIHPDYIPTPYGIGTGISEDGTQMHIYTNEWMTGYLEAHIDQEVNGKRFILWGTREGKRVTYLVTDGSLMREIAIQIYKVLTLYSELELGVVFLNTGDFAVKLDKDNRLHVCLITARELSENPRIAYLPKSNTFLLYKVGDFLADLLTLRVAECKEDEQNKVAWKVKNGDQSAAKVVRIADFYTVLEGFHEGVKERLKADGLAEETLQQDAREVVLGALDIFKKQLSEGVLNDKQPYVVEHKENILNAVNRYLKNLQSYDTFGRESGGMNPEVIVTRIRTFLQEHGNLAGLTAELLLPHLADILAAIPDVQRLRYVKKALEPLADSEQLLLDNHPEFGKGVWLNINEFRKILREAASTAFKNEAKDDCVFKAI